MKARNLLKNRAGSGLGRKKRRDSEIKRKKQAGRRDLRALSWTLLNASNQAKKLVGNVYRSVREKQGIVVYRQRVLETVISLRFVSLVYFERTAS